MKGTVTVLLLAGLAAGTVAVDHNLTTQAAQAVQGTRSWVQQEVNSLSHTPGASEPSSIAMVPPRVTLGAMGAASPTVAPAAALRTPHPLPTPPFAHSTYHPNGSQAVWSAAECAWALPAMERDLSLDQQEVVLLENGQDSRFPPSAIPVYIEWARRWGIVVPQIQAICQNTQARIPSALAIAQTLAWFSAAAQAHLADEQVRPDDRDWDTQWIAAYTRLEADYRELPA